MSVESGWNWLTLIDHHRMHTVHVDRADKQHLSLCTDFRDFKRYSTSGFRLELVYSLQMLHTGSRATETSTHHTHNH